MNQYATYLKEKSLKDKENFFGEIKKTSNKYFKFTRVIDNDNIIIVSRNVVANRHKGYIFMAIDNNKAIFLNAKNVRKCSTKEFYGFAVKLNRNDLAKICTFKNDFEDFGFEVADDFDTLLQVAKEQDAQNEAITLDKFNGQDLYDMF